MIVQKTSFNAISPSVASNTMLNVESDWDTSVAQWLSVCSWLGSWSWGPGVLRLSPTWGSLQGACFSLCLCLCLSFYHSWINKILKKKTLNLIKYFAEIHIQVPFLWKVGSFPRYPVYPKKLIYLLSKYFWDQKKKIDMSMIMLCTTTS